MPQDLNDLCVHSYFNKSTGEDRSSPQVPLAALLSKEFIRLSHCIVLSWTWHAFNTLTAHPGLQWNRTDKITPNLSLSGSVPPLPLNSHSAPVEIFCLCNKHNKGENNSLCPCSPEQGNSATQCADMSENNGRRADWAMILATLK